MSESVVRLVVFGALLLHGLGHGGAIGALAWIERFPDRDSGGWRAARSWALPFLRRRPAAWVASAFWALALGGFVVAALSYGGILLPGGAWRPVAVGSALLSSCGIALFLGTWPAFNTLAAMGMNAAVLIALSRSAP